MTLKKYALSFKIMNILELLYLERIDRSIIKNIDSLKNVCVLSIIEYIKMENKNV